MENKYFLHRIQEENNTFTKGIEIHDNLDDAIRSFWGRMKVAFNNPNMPFAHCKIEDVNGFVVPPYDMVWNSEENYEGKYFLHSIRVEGDTVTKGIDTYDSIDQAKSLYAAAMEYGYNNPKFPNVRYVSCEITAKSGATINPYNATWVKPEAEPENEPEVSEEE